jgi:hypothetical protein
LFTPYGLPYLLFAYIGTNKFHMKINCLLLFLVVCISTVHAQKVTMKADKTSCNQYDQINLTVELDDDNDSIGIFKPKGFNIKGPFQKVAVSYVNGKSTFRKLYTYILRPKTIGTLTIESPRVYFGDKGVTAAPVTIKVNYGPPAKPYPPLDRIADSEDYIDNPDGTVRFVTAGDMGYVEERNDHKWVIVRELTASEMAQIKKK